MCFYIIFYIVYDILRAIDRALTANSRFWLYYIINMTIRIIISYRVVTVNNWKFLSFLKYVHTQFCAYIFCFRFIKKFTDNVRMYGQLLVWKNKKNMRKRINKNMYIQCENMIVSESLYGGKLLLNIFPNVIISNASCIWGLEINIPLHLAINFVSESCDNTADNNNSVLIIDLFFSRSYKRMYFIALVGCILRHHRGFVTRAQLQS